MNPALPVDAPAAGLPDVGARPAGEGDPCGRRTLTRADGARYEGAFRDGGTWAPEGEA